MKVKDLINEYNKKKEKAYESFNLEIDYEKAKKWWMDFLKFLDKEIMFK